jgi:hypothetical protein
VGYPPHKSEKIADGKWTAKISYRGDAEHGSENGGKDVLLYDIAPVAP